MNICNMGTEELLTYLKKNIKTILPKERAKILREVILVRDEAFEISDYDLKDYYMRLLFSVPFGDETWRETIFSLAREILIDEPKNKEGINWEVCPVEDRIELFKVLEPSNLPSAERLTKEILFSLLFGDSKDLSGNDEVQNKIPLDSLHNFVIRKSPRVEDPRFRITVEESISILLT